MDIKPIKCKICNKDVYNKGIINLYMDICKTCQDKLIYKDMLRAYNKNNKDKIK